MRLRPSRAPVTRLSRKVLLGLGTVAAVGIGGALFFALATAASDRRVRTLQHRATGRRRTGWPTCHATTPACRSNAPQLGPPLPGDLGRPMVMPARPRQGCRTPAAGPSPSSSVSRRSRRPRGPVICSRPPMRANRFRRHSGGGGTARAVPTPRVDRPDLTGSQARLPERRRRSADRQPRSRRGAGQPLCAPGRRGHRRGAVDRLALRSARPGHRPGHRERL